MKRLQKPPVGKTKEKKQEPLAEGLQIVISTDSAGRRQWNKMSDEGVIALAMEVMEENGITGRDELEKADSGLYGVLRRRGLLEKVGFEEKYRSWKGMSNDDIIEIVRKEMERKGITGRGELEKADSGLSSVLRKRKLLDEVGFEEKRRSWESMSDEEVVEFARKVMRENKINTRGELQKADSGLHGILKRRGLLGKIKFEEKQKSWKGISGEKVVEFAKKIMGERGISSKMELKKADCGLYMVLRRRELLGEVEFEERRRKQRSWKKMSDDEIVEIARKVMEEKQITKRKELEMTDRGLYGVLWKRGLLDRAFAHVEQQRDEGARDAVIDALSAFGSENQNSEEKIGVA